MWHLYEIRRTLEIHNGSEPTKEHGCHVDGIDLDYADLRNLIQRRSWKYDTICIVLVCCKSTRFRTSTWEPALTTAVSGPDPGTGGIPA